MPFGFRHSQQDADHLHRQFGGDVDEEVERRARHHLIEQATRPGPQIVLDATDHPRRQAGTDQSADLRMSRVVHHVEDLTGDGQVLQQRPAERPRPTRHRRECFRITKHRKRFRVGGHRPEAFAVGRVGGRFVPVDRCLAPVDGEQVVREARREVVQIREVDPGKRAGQRHRIAPDVYLAASGYRPTKSSTASTTRST